jgi:hypothetical protein
MFIGPSLFAYTFYPDFPSTTHPTVVGTQRNTSLTRIEIPMQDRINAAIRTRNSDSPLNPRITASASEMDNGIFEIQVTVSGDSQRQRTVTVAFAGEGEIMTDGIIDNSKVRAIANETINIVLNQPRNIQNLD